jgi:hypothetical protein
MSQSRKKDLSKIKFFIYHKHGHYASQGLDKKKGKGKQQQKQVATSAKTQMNELIAKFEKDFSMVSCLSTNTVPRNVWYVDSGASCHMTYARQLFSSLIVQKYSFCTGSE